MQYRNLTYRHSIRYYASHFVLPNSAKLAELGEQRLVSSSNRVYAESSNGLNANLNDGHKGWRDDIKRVWKRNDEAQNIN